MSRFSRRLERLTAEGDVDGLLRLVTYESPTQQRLAVRSAFDSLLPDALDSLIEAVYDPAVGLFASDIASASGPVGWRRTVALLLQPQLEPEAVEAASSSMCTHAPASPSTADWDLILEVINVSPYPRAVQKAMQQARDWVRRASWAAPAEAVSLLNASRRRPARQHAGEAEVEIPLRGGSYALIDADDLALVEKHQWRAWTPGTGRAKYAVVTGSGEVPDTRMCAACGEAIERNPRTGRWPKYCDDCKKLTASERAEASAGYRDGLDDYFVPFSGLFMHRLIMEPPQGYVVHHRNGDGLDNRRRNLAVLWQEQHQDIHDADRLGEERWGEEPTPTGVVRHGLPEAKPPEPSSTWWGTCCQVTLWVIIAIVILAVVVVVWTLGC